MAGNFWVGLALLHSLFMREHNAVCDRLHAEYPELTDQQLYEKARLVVAALMAKIHTVDWTPAIIAHPTTVLGMRANWYGLLGERFDRTFGRKTRNEVIRGIPGSPTNHHGVPYSLTEEFVAVYRMHPLIPDEFVFRSLADDSVLQERELPELGALEVRNRLGEMSMTDLFYSFGRLHPGAITLHNYPRFLQDFHRPGGDHIDLAAIDILRLRERGVPRYNDFRRLFHLKPAATFDELTDNPVWARELRAGLRGRREGRRDDRDVRGAEAEGVRVQRHGVPGLHPDGVAANRERPLLHHRLPARGLHAGRIRLGRGEHDARRCCSATSRSSRPRSRASRTRSRRGRPSAPAKPQRSVRLASRASTVLVPEIAVSMSEVRFDVSPRRPPTAAETVSLAWIASASAHRPVALRRDHARAARRR